MSKKIEEQMLLLNESFDAVGIKFNVLTWQRIEKSHLEFSQSQIQELIESMVEIHAITEKSSAGCINIGNIRTIVDRVLNKYKHLNQL